MKIWYEAIDGAMFDAEEYCLSHEATINHRFLKDIILYQKIKNEYVKYHINPFFIFDDNCYQSCDKIIIHNEDELNDLHWLAEECGWCEFNEQISSPGTWIRHEEDGNGYWTLVKE